MMGSPIHCPVQVSRDIITLFLYFSPEYRNYFILLFYRSNNCLLCFRLTDDFIKKCILICFIIFKKFVSHMKFVRVTPLGNLTYWFMGRWHEHAYDVIIDEPATDKVTFITKLSQYLEVIFASACKWMLFSAPYYTN